VAKSVHPKLGTIAFPLDGETCEYTPFRRESYSMGRHAPDHVAFGVGLEEDALRRDFSCNAIYYDLSDSQIVDPTGGVADLEQRRLRAARADARITFADDPLRLLRLIRIGGELGFTPEENTFEAARAQAPLLQSLAPARIGQELKRILLSDIRYDPSPITVDQWLRQSTRQKAPDAILPTLQRLFSSGALFALFPDFALGENTRQRPQYHAYPVLEHSLRVCAATPPDLVLRLAGLFHDIAKPFQLEAQGNFYQHDQEGAIRTRAALEPLGFGREAVDAVCVLVGEHMFDLASDAKEATVLRKLAKLGPEAFRRLICLRMADIWGSGRTLEVGCALRWQAVLQRAQAQKLPLTAGELALDGRGIMEALAIAPGPQVGWAQKRLLAYAMRHPAQNTPEALRRYLRGIAGEYRPDQ